MSQLSSTEKLDDISGGLFMIHGQRIPVGPGFATVLPDMDFETYSEVGYYWDGPGCRWRGVTRNQAGLAAVGAPVYSEHPSTEVLSLAYDLKDGKPWRLWVPGMHPPQELFDHISSGGLIEAWNSSFEYYIWTNVCEKRMGWDKLPLNQLRCAMSKSRSWSLPGALGKAAEVLQAPEQKDKGGALLLRKLSIPKSPTKKDYRLRRTPEKDPVLFSQLYGYNGQDIKAEASASQMIPDLTPSELDLWKLDQRINTQGVHIDKKALEDCIHIINASQEKYNAELREITGGAVQAASEIQKIQKWLQGQGVNMGSLDKEHVAHALSQENPHGLPPHALRVLEIRTTLGASSVKKLFSLARRTSEDCRIRDLFAFCGADRTGRFCVAEDEPVLVKSATGQILEIPIQNVTEDMLLWDGETWVAHGGVVKSGLKEVITHDGITATPGHRVFTSPTEYTTLKRAKENGTAIFRGENTCPIVSTD